MKKKLIYNDKSSADMGLVIQAPPVYNLPERDVEKTHVPGRNGDVITDNGCYQNVEREYRLAKEYAYGPVKTTVKNGQEFYEWLTSAKGKYVRLEDDYDPDVYRIATYIESGALTDIFDKAFTFNAKFNCKPQRYLKLGDIPIEYNYSSQGIKINNLTHYPSNPKIEIQDLPYGNAAVTLMSVKDNEGSEIALITLKGDSTKLTTLVIDSENEECIEKYTEDDQELEKDASEKITLNGKNFPVLKDGETTIKISQYDGADYEIDSYDSVIKSKQEVVESSFSPKETTIKSFEEKYIIRPFKTLISERENTFNADSYVTRLTELCDQGIEHDGINYALSYTIQSPNDYLNGTIVEFKKESASDCRDKINAYGLGSLLNVVTVAPYYKINVASGTKAYVKQSNGRLKQYDSNATILDMNNDENKDGLTLEIFPDIVASIKKELPTFMSANSIFSDGTLNSISYYIALTEENYGNSPKAIYYKNKVGLTGLFGKAGWYSCQTGTVLVSYVWNTTTKKFSINGQLLSLDNGYNIKFVCFTSGIEGYNPKDYMQYDFGKDSSEIFKIDDVTTSSNPMTISIKSVNSGFYKLDKGANNEWQSVNEDSSLTTVSMDKSFKVEYLKEIPKYSNESDWPSWLNSAVVYYDSYDDVVSGADILNSSYMKIKVNLATYYRKYETINDVETSGNWYQINVNDYIRDINGNQELKINRDTSVTIGRYYSTIWQNPASVPSFTYDRAYKDSSGTISGVSPDWLRCEVEMKIKLNSDPSNEYIVVPDFIYIHTTDTTIVQGKEYYTRSSTEPYTYTLVQNPTQAGLSSYYEIMYIYTHDYWYGTMSGKVYDNSGNETGYVIEEPTIFFYAGDYDSLPSGGFYKYDASNTWVYHSYEEGYNDFIIKINYKDSVTFYFIEEMPDQYPSHPEKTAWKEFLRIQRNPSGDKLSPQSIKFIVNEGKDGYYKVNSLVNWKYYKAGEVCFESLVNETNTLHRLNERTAGSLSGVTIIITPKWWML